MLASLTNTQGIVAIAAAAAAAVALIACIVLSLSVRRLRRAQRVVLGEHGNRDIIAQGADLEGAFNALRDHVDATAASLHERMGRAEASLRGAISHSALVRYDAYNELSGRQSMSIALLDDESSGIVLSCIHHRDQARVYGKQVRAGHGELELSPEEAEAVRLAVEGGPVPSRGMSEAAETPAPRPRVGYLGPEGTFSEEALLSSAAPDAVEPVALATISDAVMALPRR